ncbi:MAG: NLP/P60 protein [Candidatus Jorgensenbacteria bacterium GW2011_GWA1_48_11]|uniref:NLP/P60 protein n=1 Tax=Candidatus Jorgensenbacteria bacterium GW2011_GWA1_48_11 TaxID=1618660 RepID=A0A0G1UC08_9BACT|nr:MAG: NLP/P60 protein [Candidatus Jorgensenbacteria bacterium GW2011_GWA1_48_11]KKW12182.1 MAG: NLP/P60 protein [Candidatus Jorgensenbacteria bacterium GW2011_GWB1_49_9]
MTTETQKEKIVALAKSLIGKPYKYGAKEEEAPDFFDCSSFTQYILKQIGIAIPRSTIEQAAEGRETNLENLEVGDLIFAHGTHGHYNPRFPQGIGHVGVYVGNDAIIHAASKRTNEKPIIEQGGVMESTLEEFIKACTPIITIKHY